MTRKAIDNHVGVQNDLGNKHVKTGIEGKSPVSGQ